MRRSPAAFTLIELMVASVVTVMVAGAALMILSGTATARERLDGQRELRQQAGAAARAIAVAVRNVHRPADPEQDQDPEFPAFEGTSDALGILPRDRLRLLSISHRPIRPEHPESDLREMEFFILDPTGMDPALSPALMRRTDPTRNPPPDGGGVVERIADDVRGLNITYYDGVVWRDEWRSSIDGWPKAVKIEVVVAPDDEPGSGVIATRLVNFPGFGDTNLGLEAAEEGEEG